MRISINTEMSGSQSFDFELHTDGNRKQFIFIGFIHIYIYI